MLSLIINPGSPNEETVILQKGSSTIGRTKDNDIYCLHKSLSRSHARLEYDGKRLEIIDLGSKNGIQHNGRRVAKTELHEGDTFRCGDISFLVEGATTRSPRSSTGSVSIAAQTLPSPLAMMGRQKSAKAAGPDRAAREEEDARYKDKLFVMIRASELLVGDLTVDRMLEELVVLAVQVLEVERAALLTLEEETAQMVPRVVKSFTTPGSRPYSERVVDWVVDRRSAASFADVSHDPALRGDPAPDASIRSAMCVPLHHGGGVVGAFYVDNLAKADVYRPDDLALLRALGNLASTALELGVHRDEAGRESDETGEGDRKTYIDPPRTRR